MPMIDENGASSSADGATPQADAPPPGEAVVYLRDMTLMEEKYVNFEHRVRQMLDTLLKALPGGAKGGNDIELR
eukprot:4926527-Heterocapsa_arctica.AAC.1